MNDILKDIKPELLEAIRMVDAATGSYSTGEQVAFASDFTKPMISFSNPGTGKTHSVVHGLIIAQTYHGMPGRFINAMSFTDASTAELCRRYKAACAKCNMTPTVKFNTFHQICLAIVKEAYPDISLTGTSIREADLLQLQDFMGELDLITEDLYVVKRVYETIDKLNHAMVYDPDNVMESYAFNQLNMDMDVFQELRKKLFRSKLYARSIAVGDIPLYALFALCKKPSIQKKYKEMYKIMIVDEFQDMTKLYLVILSMISSNLIVIGDMKQQIYGFNGANPYIAEMYRQMYPEARSINLTQSFRCGNEIADYATKIYEPNDPELDAFKGVSSGAEVIIKPASELNIDQIVDSIAADVENAYAGGTQKSTMFLFRNNYSITPIAEALYKKRVKFRVKNFAMIMDMPIYKELCYYANIAEAPDNIENLKMIPFIFPQFEKYKSTFWQNPVYQAAEQMRDRDGYAPDFFNIPMRWSSESIDIINVLKGVRKRMNEGCQAETVFQILLPLYEEYVIRKKWYKLPKPAEYYMDMVTPIASTKTYTQLKTDERAKLSFTNDAIKLNIGVKCYTVHSAKGLEADEVYIIDADDNTFPSAKRVKKMIKEGCQFEAAKTVREERDLLYVGVTRAKSKVVITYNGRLSPLLQSPMNNEFTMLDEVYQNAKKDYDDMTYFKEITNIYEKIERLDSAVTYINEEDFKEVNDSGIARLEAI